jgi:hypothetical protein
MARVRHRLDIPLLWHSLKDMTVRTTVRLPEDLVGRARQRAAVEGRSLSALIEDGLPRLLNERASAGQQGVPPPVSSARGGLMPGIDLSDSAAVQELEDIAQAGGLR